MYVSVQYICSPSCQDVSSLGNNLSRCFVFRHRVQYMCSPSCQDVSSLDNTVASKVVSAAVVMLNSLFTCTCTS